MLSKSSNPGLRTATLDLACHKFPLMTSFYFEYMFIPRVSVTSNKILVYAHHIIAKIIKLKDIEILILNCKQATRNFEKTCK